jgi:glycosyltransferase involved in cell wall biosynthesis
MSEQKIDIVHFHNGSGGGVLSVIRNLLRYSSNEFLFNHVIFTINKKLHPNYQLPELQGAASVQLFYFSPDWNFYYTCRKLASLLPSNDAVIVAHDWLELGMVSNLGLQNPVVQVLHGDYDYYYQLAKKHAQWIDTFIGVSDCIVQKLKVEIPSRVDDIAYQRFPVPGVNSELDKPTDFTAIFVGRCTRQKGYHLLPEIASRLAEAKIKIRWNIVSEIDKVTKEFYPWPANIDVIFHGELSNDSLLALLGRIHLFILPSIAEGMPVAMIEAMKAGVVPIVNNLSGGIDELIIDGKRGYKIVGNSVESYVACISSLLEKRSKIEEMAHLCHKTATEMFDPIKNTVAYEKLFLHVEARYVKHPKKIYGSRLDSPWIPNFFTYKIRKLKPLQL